jgi:nucleoside-diphosphate-sugar epimerase
MPDWIQTLNPASLAAAIKGNSNPDPPKVGTTYSEADWNETSTLPVEAYWVSKVQAEKAAWELAQQHGLDLVTILPGNGGVVRVLCCLR